MEAEPRARQEFQPVDRLRRLGGRGQHQNGRIHENRLSRSGLAGDCPGLATGLVIALAASAASAATVAAT